MAVDVDSEKPNGIDSTFALQLLTFQRIRNGALGIDYDNHLNIGLLQFAYQLQQQETKDVLATLGEATFLKNVIVQCRAEIKRMIGEAETAEDRRRVLPVVQKLYDQAERAEIRLKALNE